MRLTLPTRAPWLLSARSTTTAWPSWVRKFCSRMFLTPALSFVSLSGNQIDGINKNKAKSEKDKSGMERDLQEARAGLEEAMRDRANMEKNCKMAQGLIVESNQKQDELARALNDADSTKKKLLVESQDLSRQVNVQERLICL